jgi:hypothetical protein
MAQRHGQSGPSRSPSMSASLDAWLPGCACRYNLLERRNAARGPVGGTGPEKRRSSWISGALSPPVAVIWWQHRRQPAESQYHPRHDHPGCALVRELVEGSTTGPARSGPREACRETGPRPARSPTIEVIFQKGTARFSASNAPCRARLGKLEQMAAIRNARNDNHRVTPPHSTRYLDFSSPRVARSAEAHPTSAPVATEYVFVHTVHQLQLRTQAPAMMWRPGRER